MDAQQAGMNGGRHLSQIQEEPDSRRHSILPPISQHSTGESDRPGNQQVTRLSEPAYEQTTKLEDNNSLLEQLGRIEAELRESSRQEVEREQETEFIRRQENHLMRSDLCYLSLSQRVTKPWVNSYFKMFPMHIYCLPVRPANQNGRRRGALKKRK